MSSQAAYVIRNLASADENQTKFVEHGVLPPLHALILSQQNSSIIASLAALRNLSIHPKNETAIMEGGFPDLLSDIIKDSKLPDMLNHAIGTIRYRCVMLPLTMVYSAVLRVYDFLFYWCYSKYM